VLIWSTIAARREKGRIKRKLVAALSAGVFAWGQIAPAFATIDNTVTATFSDGGTVLTTTRTENVDVQNAAPGLTLNKSSSFNDGGNGPTIGDVISYTFVVENTGNVTLNDVRVTELFSGTGVAPTLVTPVAVTTDSGTVPPAQLAAVGQLNDSSDTGSADNDWDVLGPGDVITFTASYPITQQDIDVGNVTNNATASGRTPSNANVSSADQTRVDFNATSSLTMVKTGVLVPGSNGRADVGDDINYQFVVTNTGQTTLNSVTINDPLLSASLPQEQRFFASLDAIRTGFDTTATASIAPEVKPVQSPTPMPLLGLNAEMAVERRIVRLSNEAKPFEAGESVAIIYEIVNTGDVPLTGITAQANGAQAFNAIIDVLAPNQGDKTNLIFAYDLTQADIDAGSIRVPGTLTANARGNSVTLAQSDALLLTDAALPEDVITATISPVSFGPLAPGQSTTFNSTYDLRQSDINAGVIRNTARADAVGPGGAVSSPSTTVDVPLAPVSDIALLKSAVINLGTNGATPGDTVVYTFRVSNPGNVSIPRASITFADPLLLPANPIAYVSGDPAPANNLLDPGETWTYRATYNITLDDINAGEVRNSATVSGTTVVPSSQTVNDVSHPTDIALDAPTIVPLTPQPAIAIVKPLATIADTNNSGQQDIGDTANFTFVVTNPGNVSLSNVSIADPLPNLTVPVLVSGDSNTNTRLDPGEIWTFTASAPLAQTQIDAGQIQNQATVNAITPTNTPIQDTSHPTSPTQNAVTNTPITQTPRLALIKTSTIADTNGNTVTDAGDTITYAFDVRNLGNVTVNNITINDPTIGPVSGSIGSLAQGDSDTTTFTASYVITAEDVTRGRVTNSATVNGRTLQNTPVSDVSDNSDPNQDDATITAIVAQPELAVLKTVTSLADTNNSGISDAGDTITYAFSVRNTGNVPLTQVGLTDTLATVAGGPIGTLLPGDTDTTTFTATYTVTAGDLVRGYVENSATASGTAPDTTVVSDLSDAENYTENDPTRTYLASAPRIAVIKQATGITDVNNSGTEDEGDIVNYAFTVVNTGNAVLTNVRVTDPKAIVTGGPLAQLGIAQTDTTTFTASRVITRDDLLANGITNQATGSGQPPTGARVSDLSDDASVLENDPTFTALSGVPGVAVVKKVSRIDDRNGNGITDVGDIINYSFAITNTGSVALQNITLTDNNAQITGTRIARLNPSVTNSSAFKGRHVITLADADEGSVTNQATVTARTLTGAVVSDASDNANVTENNPTVTEVAKAVPVLTKTAGRSEIRRGERVTYTIDASNLTSGPYTIIDTMPPGFAYVPNTATLGGKAVKPLLNGTTVSFAGLTPDAKGELSIKLTLLAGTSLTTGDFINRVALFDETSGTRLARADATVKIKTEHVFDCGDVIGRVFDDRNGNGYADEGEAGLPGVRVVTVNGLILTTDKNGRFHIPCADIPDAYIGTNFILKLDPRSLPTGYEITTENPRDVRLTRGKVTKLNFGASRSCNVALDIKRDAFETDSLKLKPEWRKGLYKLSDVLKECPGSLKITYRCGQHAPIADERLKALENRMMSIWKEAGEPYDLIITGSVECGK
jgi:uncharacterized repeat protein (TIGR01451 family)